MKRPQPIPPKLREAIGLMVYGHPDDPDCRAFTFIEAAHETGIKPDVMRRYLDRPEVRALLLAERRAFRAAICGGNEGALLRVRETAHASRGQKSAFARRFAAMAERRPRPPYWRGSGRGRRHQLATEPPMASPSDLKEIFGRRQLTICVCC
jgi:hypothetical protein